MSRKSSFLQRMFCTKLAKKLKVINTFHQTEMDALTKTHEDLIKELTADCETEKLRLLKQIKDLTEIMPDQLSIPNIAEYIQGPPTIYKPYEVPMPIDVGLLADTSYYALDYDDWIGALKPCFEKTKRILGKWMTDVSDCDDWALVMNAIVVASFKKAGSKIQGAFFFTRSRTHAYNVFVAPFGTSSFAYWIYEPQTGEIIGAIDDVSLPDIYKSTEMWLLGASLPPS